MSHAHQINVTSDREELKQQKLTDVFMSKKTTVSPVSSQRYDQRFILARRIILWLCKDLLPLSMVDYVGFNDFYSALHVGIPLPSRQIISIGALDDLFALMKKELHSIISTSEGGMKIHITINAYVK